MFGEAKGLSIAGNCDTNIIYKDIAISKVCDRYIFTFVSIIFNLCALSAIILLASP